MVSSNSCRIAGEEGYETGRGEGNALTPARSYDLMKLLKHSQVEESRSSSQV